MRKIELKTSRVLVLLLLCVALAAVTTRAQNGTDTGAKQSGAKSKTSPKVSSELDDDFSPKAKAKSSARPSVGDKGKVAPEEIGDPLNSDAAQADAPATSAPASVTTTTVSSPRPATAGSVPQKAGGMRLCLAVPRVQMNAGDAAQAAAAVLNTFKSYLASPTLETLDLTARLPSQALEEAKQGGCDYVLYTSLTHKKGGSGGLLGRALGDAASSAVRHIPGGGSTAGSIARSAAVSGVYTAASMAASIKAKDELTLAYKLEATDAAKPPMTKSEKAKAKSDGEDVLTPLIEKAAEAVAAVMVKR